MKLLVPFFNLLLIGVTTPIAAQLIEHQVLPSVGRQIKSFENEKEIYVGDLVNDIYFLNINTGKEILTFKIIKK